MPTSALEAKAQVQEMRTLGVTKLYVADDGGPYGATIADAVKRAASGSISVVSQPDGRRRGVLRDHLAGRRRALLRSAPASASSSIKLFAPSALDDPTIASRLSGLRNAVRFRARLPQAGPDAGRHRVRQPQFTTTYGHAPLPQAIFGYEAMSAVLAVLREAGSQANNRSTVVHDFLSIKNRQSVLGTYSMNSSGDTSIAPFVFSRLQQGKLVPFAQVQG